MKQDVARIDLRDFKTKQIIGPSVAFWIPNISGNHAGAFVAPNTEYSFMASRFSGPVPKGVAMNPIDAIRTGTLLATEGTAAFGTASLAFFRFTKGSAGATAALLTSVAFWIAAPLTVATLRLRRTDF